MTLRIKNSLILFLEKNWNLIWCQALYIKILIILSSRSVQDGVKLIIIPFPTSVSVLFLFCVMLKWSSKLSYAAWLNAASLCLVINIDSGTSLRDCEQIPPNCKIKKDQRKCTTDSRNYTPIFLPEEQFSKNSSCYIYISLPVLEVSIH